MGPAVVRASLVLFSFTYSYAVVAFAMYCSTPLGKESIASLKDDNMVQRRELFTFWGGKGRGPNSCVGSLCSRTDHNLWESVDSDDSCT